MGKISISPLFKKTLVLMIALFGTIATATSLVSGWTLYSQLTAEYQSKGAAIAESIADSSVEVLLNRDAATLQAFVDQFTEIDGVSYVFVEDRSGEILSHTFVPRVPQEVAEIRTEVRKQGAQEELITSNFYIDGIGGVIDIAVPILAGVAGYAHVGMSRDLILAQIWSAVMKQQALMFMILSLSILVAYVFVKRIAQPLNLLAEHAKTLASNDFVAGLNIPTEVEALSQEPKDEIGNLAGSFIYMERTLQQYLKSLKETTAAKERIESELKIAHDIQMSMVPKIFPPFPDRREFDLYATLVPAKEVGGDFYDFLVVRGK
jgi:methyl-accepting chemotaxis protein